MFYYLLFVLYLLNINTIGSWKQLHDSRIIGELRIVNEGLSHDDKFWYFTNKHFIYKANKSPITVNQTNYNGIPKELRELGYDHIGDIEVFNNIIYGGMEGDNPNALLGKWNATTLELIEYKKINNQNGAPWVTVNPDLQLVYSANWNDINNINVFNINTLEYMNNITINNPDIYPKEIQGASFYKGDLYVATNIKDSIFKIDIKTGICEFAFSDDQNYIIDKYYYEMEGLTFWDLYNTGKGVAHVYGNFMNIREKAIHSFEDTN